MTEQLVPLGDRLLIKRDAVQTQQGLIHLPDKHVEKPTCGTVISAGPGLYDTSGILIPCHVKAGDRVLFGRYSGYDIELNGIEYIVMREFDLLGILLSIEDEPDINF